LGTKQDAFRYFGADVTQEIRPLAPLKGAVLA
jgi:hypothetical protein